VLRVTGDARVAELRGHLARQPGWASYAAWREREGLPRPHAARPARGAAVLRGRARRPDGAGRPTPRRRRRRRPRDGRGRARRARGRLRRRLLARSTARPRAAGRPPGRPGGLLHRRALGGACAAPRGAGPTRRSASPASSRSPCASARSGSAAADAQAPVLLDPRHLVEEVPPRAPTRPGTCAAAPR
jgi:hypothetical protein